MSEEGEEVPLIKEMEKAQKMLRNIGYRGFSKRVFDPPRDLTVLLASRKELNSSLDGVFCFCLGKLFVSLLRSTLRGKHF